MSKFIQIHMISSYPPANVNRDDLGRPKTAVLGGKNRLRISSQCLKRTWRTSEVFQEALGDNKGFRTKELGKAIKESLVEEQPLWNVINDEKDNPGNREKVDEKTAEDWAGQIIEVFGDVDDGLQHSQLVFVTPEEIEEIDELLSTLIEVDREPEDEELDLLRNTTKAVDVA
ncbi:MAG: type I-E CRISPR-associated protein Cas7/Cse4/CasC, partial [Candidatus Acetothermia bacterium]